MRWVRLRCSLVWGARGAPHPNGFFPWFTLEPNITARSFVRSHSISKFRTYMQHFLFSICTDRTRNAASFADFACSCASLKVQNEPYRTLHLSGRATRPIANLSLVMFSTSAGNEPLSLRHLLRDYF